MTSASVDLVPSSYVSYLLMAELLSFPMASTLLTYRQLTVEYLGGSFTTGLVSQVSSYHSTTLEFTELLRASHSLLMLVETVCMIGDDFIHLWTWKGLEHLVTIIWMGSGEGVLIIESKNLDSLNDMLAKVTYQSIVYHVHTGDLVTVSYRHHKVVFPVTIKLPKVPVLFNMGKDIDSQVTIITKTFIRYYNLRMLIKSIRGFYPNITIIIADDSFEPQPVTGEKIRQYIMPPGQGWFAGRNLAVSQVMTKYFLWVDDDYEFTEETKIERMVQVMEANPELDVLGGSVTENRFFFTVIYEEGNDTEGGCLSRRSEESFTPLPGFPGCYLVSGVVNFFLARTDSLQKSGFDPKLQRVAHSEYFIDGAGSLMVASCGDVIVGHQTNKSKEDAWRYKHYRNPGKEDVMFKDRLMFYKNNLKCIHWR